LPATPEEAAVRQILDELHRKLLLERPRRPHETFREAILAAVAGRRRGAARTITAMRKELDERRAAKAEALRLQKQQADEKSKAFRVRLGSSNDDGKDKDNDNNNSDNDDDKIVPPKKRPRTLEEDNSNSSSVMMSITCLKTRDLGYKEHRNSRGVFPKQIKP
jgi:hypothetical protein